MKVVIIHGTLGNPEGNWFPWLRSVLLKNSWDVYIPQFPTPDKQTLEGWENVLSYSLREADLFVGHSLGATFILRALEAGIINSSKVILVSGVIDKINNAEYDNLNEPFIHKPYNWATIRSHVEQATVLHGNNDPYVPIEQAESIAANLKVDLHVIQNGGHLNAEAGYTKFPEILEFIDG